ncbi:MAG TPA: TonB family protein [Syntrophales bacterium]|nr:TonB family protein [Syntrophales bacterium]
MTVKTLRWRGDGLTRLNTAIALSLLIHAIALSVLFFSPAFPSKTWTFGPAYSVDLVNAPASVGKSATAALSREIMNEALKENARDNAISLKKSIVTKTPTPLLKQDAPTKKQDAARLNQAIEEMRKRAESSEAGGQPFSGQGNTASLMSQYYSQIWSKVRQNWALPQSILADKNLEAVLDVTVLRNGQVTNIAFEKRSGNSYFDQSAYRAIRKSDPFPPLPAWIQDSSVELGIKFHSAEYKK